MFIQNGLSVQTMWQSIVADLSMIQVWLPVVFLAIFGSIVGLTAYLRGQAGIEASEAVMFRYLEPLVYIPLNVAIFSNLISPTQLLFLLLIMTGVYIGEKRWQEPNWPVKLLLRLKNMVTKQKPEFLPRHHR